MVALCYTAAQRGLRRGDGRWQLNSNSRHSRPKHHRRLRCIISQQPSVRASPAHPRPRRPYRRSKAPASHSNRSRQFGSPHTPPYHTRQIQTTTRPTRAKPNSARVRLYPSPPFLPFPLTLRLSHPKLTSIQPTALRILQDRLPTLLQTPLPQEVLSPHISLHLFPSTHPHLPTVTGRVAYVAALWSSPIAWNRVPLVGNVRLEILSERMVDSPVVAPRSLRRGGDGGPDGGFGGRPAGAVGEQLVVRWRTVGGGGLKLGMGKRGLLGLLNHQKQGGGGGETRGAGEGGDGESTTEVKAPVGMAQAVGASNKEFTGLFIFDFDSEGRILSHTIEHVQEDGQWEKGVGAKVVGLTDWLLGGIKGGDTPCPAFARVRFRKGRL